MGWGGREYPNFYNGSYESPRPAGGLRDVR